MVFKVTENINKDKPVSDDNGVSDKNIELKIKNLKLLVHDRDC
jgi:hypothetical protein